MCNPSSLLDHSYSIPVETCPLPLSRDPSFRKLWNSFIEMDWLKRLREPLISFLHWETWHCIVKQFLWILLTGPEMVASCAAINVTRCGTTCREIWLNLEILNDSGKINHEGYFFYFFEFFFRLHLMQFYRLWMVYDNI